MSEGPDQIVPSVRRIDRTESATAASTGAERASAAATRLAVSEDLATCTEIWQVGIADYQRRLNQPDFPGDLEPLRRFLAHLLDTDPAHFWVATRPAEEDGDRQRVVGFGAAVERGQLWFLSMLFLRPETQAAGLGRALLMRTFPGGVAPGSPGALSSDGPTILATATDSVQPISNALYSRFGIVPRLPVFHFIGRPDRHGGLPALPSGITPVRFDSMAAGPPDGSGHRELVGTVAAIDRALLGFEHPQDHRFMRVEGRIGYLYRGPDGAPVGYGYTSQLGRVGPVAALDEALLAPIVGHLLGAIEPLGASSLWVSGAAGPTFRGLLGAGLRFEGFPALLCWNRPFASFERYLPISLGLL